MKGANKQMRMIVTSIQKKLGANEPVWAQKWCIVIILDPL